MWLLEEDSFVLSSYPFVSNCIVIMFFERIKRNILLWKFHQIYKWILYIHNSSFLELTYWFLLCLSNITLFFNKQTMDHYFYRENGRCQNGNNVELFEVQCKLLGPKYPVQIKTIHCIIWRFAYLVASFRNFDRIWHIETLLFNYI